jgi:hypothetical protein
MKVSGLGGNYFYFGCIRLRVLDRIKFDQNKDFPMSLKLKLTGFWIFFRDFLIFPAVGVIGAGAAEMGRLAMQMLIRKLSTKAPIPTISLRGEIRELGSV